MIVANILDVVDENKNVYMRDILNGYIITHYDGKNNISDNVLHNVVERITTTEDGSIVLEIMHDVTDFDDLGGEAKLNCLQDYIYKICPYEHFDDMSILEIEECVREFWKVSEYTLDKYGIWYDEDFNRI